MLIRVKAMQYVGGLVKDRGTGKRNHDKSKDSAQRKSEQGARHDKTQRRESADREDRSEKTEIAARYKHRRGNPEEQTKCHHACLEQDRRIIGVIGRDHDQRNKYYRLGDNENSEA